MQIVGVPFDVGKIQRAYMQRRSPVRRPPTQARPWVLLLLYSWMCGHVVHAQSADQSGSPVRVRGIVVNAITQTPIGRALVTSVDQQMALMTDDKGRFEFHMKPPAGPAAVKRGVPGNDVAYLAAKKPGYLVMTHIVPVVAADLVRSKAELRLELTPEASISGQIGVPESGTPQGLTVQLIRKQIQDGEATWMQADSREADPRGRYRFAALTPGDYKVVTADWADRVGPYQSTAGHPITGYPPAAFPSGSTQVNAGVIHLSAGQNLVADVNLRATRYYSVEVPIASPSHMDNVGVNVESEDGSDYLLGFNGQTQRVEGYLPDGVYHLTLTANATLSLPTAVPKILAGSADIVVADKPVHATPISLLPGITIQVIVQEEFTGPDPSRQVEAASLPTPDADAPVGTGQVAGLVVSSIQPIQAEPPKDHQGNVIKPRPVDLYLMPVTGKGMVARVTDSDQSGQDSLQLVNVLPGSYKLQVGPYRGYAASVTANGVNLLREPLVIVPGATPPQIAIVLRDDVATIHGTISSAVKQDPTPRPRIVWAFPLGDDATARPASGFQQPDGTFALNAVVPGRYLVLASQTESLNLEYRSREAMKAYEGKGVIVSVSSNQNVEVELKNLVMDESWDEMETVE